MKMPIKWHEDCLRWRGETLERQRVIAERAVEEMERTKREMEFYAGQIEGAKKRGKDGFDAERFMKNRR